MKTIIKRNLDLSKKYYLEYKTYIPLFEGVGCTCANCNKLIANIATVKDQNNNTFKIGLDCLETLMLSTNILEGQKIDFLKVKKDLPKIKRGLKEVKEFLEANTHLKIDSVKVEKSSDWYSYYFYTNSKCVYNISTKLKDVEADFYIQTLKDNFKNIKIYYE